ncbi:MAG: AAA family ATPase [Candidatus Aenigmarchaeota archaeon]|nr:AAA family ATPase [Candidatus Aenigmarchaeota archaeon]
MIIGLYLRHIKAYKGIKFIPIGENYNFVSYIGENGAGKSSILEALDSFFNNKEYLINKDAIEAGIHTVGYNPYILPIFLIEKTKISKRKKEFEKISSFFWSIEKKDTSPGIQGSMKDFFKLREKIKNKKDTHYLIAIGETNLTAGHKIYYGSFHNEENFLLAFLGKKKSEINGRETKNRKDIIDNWKEEMKKELDKSEWRQFLQEIKDLYSYVYLPVELEVESFTKIETDEMQKIFDKQLKNEIKSALGKVNFDNAGGINKKLESFVSEIEATLNNEYCYSTGMLRYNRITQSDLVEKIIESYFQKRILYKKDGYVEKKVSELSAGEKRQALVNLVYAFLAREEERDKMIIIGIDEPENSLHTSLCYDQFEKLREISQNNQILITTHWYGFLPFISKGYGHFLNSNEKGINFETYDLYDYKSKVKKDIETSQNKIPNDFSLKSTNDLVQAIFYSLKKENPYNWLIVEGISEKIYFEYFFKEEVEKEKLRILPLGGQNKVSELYEYLELPIKNENRGINGKIYCLIDTDQQEHKKHIGNGYNNLRIRRLSNKKANKKTELLSLSNGDTSEADIEQSLNPVIFKKTIEKLTTENKYHISTIENNNGNTHFIKNFDNTKLENFFKENDGENKILFAKKYIELMKKEDKPKKFIPDWIKEIKEFFNKNNSKI